MPTFQFGYIAGGTPQELFLNTPVGGTYTFTEADFATGGNASVEDTNSIYENDQDDNQILTLLDGGGPTINGLTSELEATIVLSWTDALGAPQSTTIGWVVAVDSTSTDVVAFIGGEIPPAGTTVTIVYKNIEPDPVPFSDFATFAEIVCFTAGTRILTERGEVTIEDLQLGDLVQTMDNGLQPIRWIGNTTRPAQGHFAPVLIREGALGNTSDLKVSPNHRMLLTGWRAKALFGTDQILATAASLINDHSILRASGGTVEYYHILFDQHEIIFSNGAPSESFYPSAAGLNALDIATRDEVLSLFPDLETKAEYTMARPALAASEAVLAQAMLDVK